MNLKQKTTLIIVIIISLIILLIINSLNIRRAESDGVRIYAAALEEYKSNNYTTAYKMFGKISSHSSLKPAAIYRQAKAAEHMQSPKLVMKHYKRLIRQYPNFGLSVKIKYLIAQNVYDEKPLKSQKLFKKIIKEYPHSEYAIASEYYLGLIQILELSEQTNPTKLALDVQKAQEHFKAYLKEAPSGRYAIASIQKLKELSRTSLTSEENLLIARSLYSLGDFETAKKHLDASNVANSWVDIVKNAYELKDYNTVKSYTERGVKEYSANVEQEDLYKAIDLYISAVGSQSKAVANLLNTTKTSKAQDYLLYLRCNTVAFEIQPACFSDLYAKFPDGQFSAEALYNMFYANVKYQRFNSAKQLGKKHLSKFKKSNSTPAVLFWMGKIEEKLKNYEASRVYYNKVINEFPDTYFAYRSYVDMYRIEDSMIAKDLMVKPVVFPYIKSKDGNLVIKLALLKDYPIVNELCKNDKFVQSWLAYQRGEYNQSAVMARDAMENLEVKPPKDDFRWRLVYPIHYYDLVKEFALNNNPVLILSIIKEESHFDPMAQSLAGARGLMQLMPQTAKDVRTSFGLKYNDDNYLFTPAANIQLGNLYYSQLKRMLGNNDFYAILAYNGGIGSVRGWRKFMIYDDMDDFLEQVPFSETQNYLKKVFRTYWNYARIYD